MNRQKSNLQSVSKISYEPHIICERYRKFIVLNVLISCVDLFFPKVFLKFVEQEKLLKVRKLFKNPRLISLLLGVHDW